MTGEDLVRFPVDIVPRMQDFYLPDILFSGSAGSIFEERLLSSLQSLHVDPIEVLADPIIVEDSLVERLDRCLDRLTPSDSLVQRGVT